MSEIGYRKITLDGLWHNNVTMVQILGLCPTLAVTTNLVNGLGMGIATTLVLIGSNLIISAIRNIVRADVRIPVFVLVIASLVTIIDLAMSAYLTELHHVLGIFIPLIVVNCLIIGRAEAFASRNNVIHSLADAVAMGIGFTLALMTLGGLRELVGFGTLFSQAHLMFGEGARTLTLNIFPDYPNMLLAILPPGAVLGLGLMIAGKNYLNTRAEQRAAAATALPASDAQTVG
ncbi:MAG TPA: electron transport complex subunit E [Gammaproteobacteria bacterium]